MAGHRTNFNRVFYVTSSEFKIDEIRIFENKCTLQDQTNISDVIQFEISSLSIKEILEVNIETMVRAEILSAYSQILVPCIVEHAGLVFSGYSHYPGGLTKPMWDTLMDDFPRESDGASRTAIARAVVAYCDGSSIQTFVGETPGRLSEKPRGSRDFYWDTVFIPDEADGSPGKFTYAEFVDMQEYGLDYKVTQLSQSTKAMTKFVEYFRENKPVLWNP